MNITNKNIVSGEDEVDAPGILSHISRIAGHKGTVFLKKQEVYR